ncbi:MAG: hypothetical protein ABEI86_01460, partial [Halobacteriaceae archaeon]
NTNPDSDDIHELITEYDLFTELLEDLDTDRHSYEFLTAVEGVGKQIGEAGVETEMLGDREVGWIRLLWEAHHEDGDHNKPTIEGIA